MKKLFIPFFCLYISGFISTFALAKPKNLDSLSCQSLGIQLIGEAQVLQMDPQTHKTTKVLVTQEIRSISKETESYESVFLTNIKNPVQSIQILHNKKESKVSFKEHGQRVSLLNFNTHNYLALEPNEEFKMTILFKNKQKCQLGVALNEID